MRFAVQVAISATVRFDSVNASEPLPCSERALEFLRLCHQERGALSRLALRQLAALGLAACSCTASTRRLDVQSWTRPAGKGPESIMFHAAGCSRWSTRLFFAGAGACSSKLGVGSRPGGGGAGSGIVRAPWRREPQPEHCGLGSRSPDRRRALGQTSASCFGSFVKERVELDQQAGKGRELR